jgi:hypothetical protein
MLMNTHITSDISVLTTGTGLAVRAGATAPMFAPATTITFGLVPTRWRPSLD